MADRKQHINTEYGARRISSPSSNKLPLSSLEHHDSTDSLNDSMSTILSTMHALADEQELVQKKTFTNWINSFLSKCDPPLRIVDLFQDIKDGTKLLHLLQILTGKKLAIEKRAKLRVHFLCNISVALKFIQDCKIKLVNINAADIADGKPAIVLGLVWTIILYFQIEEMTRMMEDMEQNLMENDDKQDKSVKIPKNVSPKKKGAKKAMLEWAMNMMSKNDYGVEVKDFGPSWRDGRAFNALLHSLCPDSVDMTSINDQTNIDRLEHAFSAAEKHLGIFRLLDPEDIDVDKPDEKSVMTYVAKFLALRSNETGSSDTVDLCTPFEQLEKWLTVAENRMLIIDQLTNDADKEYKQYEEFIKEMENMNKTYISVIEICTKEQSITIKKRWTSIENKSKLWQWKLDSNLPGKVGKIGDFLYRSEERLYLEAAVDGVTLIDSNIDTSKVDLIVNENQTFTTELKMHQKELKVIQKANQFDNKLPKSQLSNMTSRYTTTVNLSDSLSKKLLFDQQRSHLMIFLNESKSQLKEYTTKYGQQTDVEHLIEKCERFVSSCEIDYSRNRENVQETSVAYSAAIPSLKGDIEESVEALVTIWNAICSEMSASRSMLTDTISHWTRYVSCRDILIVSIDKAEHMSKDVQLIDQAKDILQTQKEKCKILEASSKFLIQVCHKDLALTIYDEYMILLKRYDEAKDKFEKLSEQKEFEKANHLTEEFNNRIEWIENWIVEVEKELKVQGTAEELNTHIQSLEAILCDIEPMKTKFKEASDIVYEMAKNSPKDKMNSMLEILGSLKERLNTIEILTKQSLPKLCTLRPLTDEFCSRVKTVGQWCEQAEGILSDQQNSIDHIDEHRDVQDIILEYSNYFESIGEQFDSLKNSDLLIKEMTYMNIEFIIISALKTKILILRDDLENIQRISNENGKKLNDIKNQMTKLQTSKENLEYWIEEANEILLDDNETRHLEFFNKSDKLLVMNEYENCLSETPNILECKDELFDTYSHIINFEVPIKLKMYESESYLKLLKEKIESASTIINKIEKSLLEGRKDINIIYDIYQNEFVKSDPLFGCLNDLKKLNEIQKRIAEFSKKKANKLQNNIVEHELMYNSIKEKSENIFTNLKALVKQWPAYHVKLTNFNDWMTSVGEALKHIEGESMNQMQYESNINSFKEIVNDVEVHESTLTEIESDLNVIVSKLNPDNSVAINEKKELDIIKEKYKLILPAIEIRIRKTTLILRCIDYWAAVSDKAVWIQEIELQFSTVGTQSTDNIISLQANSQTETEEHLIKYKAIGKRVESEIGELQVSMDQGNDLLGQGDAKIEMPDFLSTKVNSLQSTIDRTQELVEQYIHAIKVGLAKWKVFDDLNDGIHQRLNDGKKCLNHSEEIRSFETHLSIKENVKLEIVTIKEDIQKLRSLSLNLDSGDQFNDEVKVQIKDYETQLMILEPILDDKIITIKEMMQDYSKINKDVDNVLNSINVIRNSLRNGSNLKNKLPSDIIIRLQEYKSELDGNIILLNEAARKLTSNSESNISDNMQCIQRVKESSIECEIVIEEVEKNIRLQTKRWDLFEDHENIMTWCSEKELILERYQNLDTSLDLDSAVVLLKDLSSDCDKKTKDVETVIKCSTDLCEIDNELDLSRDLNIDIIKIQTRFSVIKEATNQRCQVFTIGANLRQTMKMICDQLDTSESDLDNIVDNISNKTTHENSFKTLNTSLSDLHSTITECDSGYESFIRQSLDAGVLIQDDLSPLFSNLESSKKRFENIKIQTQDTIKENDTRNADDKKFIDSSDQIKDVAKRLDEEISSIMVKKSKTMSFKEVKVLLDQNKSIIKENNERYQNVVHLGNKLNRIDDAKNVSNIWLEVQDYLNTSFDKISMLDESADKINVLYGNVSSVLTHVAESCNSLDIDINYDKETIENSIKLIETKKQLQIECTRDYEMFIDLSGEVIIKSVDICDEYTCKIQKNCDNLSADWNQTNELTQSIESNLVSLLKRKDEFHSSMDVVSTSLLDLENRIDINKKLNDDLINKEKSLLNLESIDSEMQTYNGLNDLNHCCDNLDSGYDDSKFFIEKCNVLKSKFNCLENNLKLNIELQKEIITEHRNYDLELINFKDNLMESVTRKINICTFKPSSIDDLNNSKQECQDLISQKNANLNKFNSIKKCSEIVITQTNKLGKQKIQNQIKEANDILTSLNEDLFDASSSLDRSINAVNLLNLKSTKLTKWTNDKTNELSNAEVKSENKFHLLNFCQEIDIEMKEEVHEMKTDIEDLIHNIQQTICPSIDLSNASLTIQEFTKFSSIIKKTNEKQNFVLENWIKEKTNELELIGCESIDDKKIYLEKIDIVTKEFETIKPTMFSNNEISTFKQIFLTKVDDLKLSIKSEENQRESLYENRILIENWVNSQYMKYIELKDFQISDNIELAKSSFNDIKILNKELMANDYSVKSIFEKAKLICVIHEPEYVDLLNKYTNLNENCQELEKKFELRYKIFESFKSHVVAFNTWYLDQNAELSRCQSNGDQQLIKKELLIIEEIDESLNEGKKLYTKMLEISENFTIDETAMIESSRIDIKNLGNNLEFLQENIESMKIKINNLLTKWQIFDIKIINISEWLSLKEQIFNSVNYDEKSIENLQSEFNLILDYQSEITDIIESSVELSKLTDDIRVHTDQGQGHKLYLRYNTLKNQTKKLLSDLQTEIAERDDHVRATKDCSDWLDSIENRLTTLTNDDVDNIEAENDAHVCDTSTEDDKLSLLTENLSDTSTTKYCKTCINLKNEIESSITKIQRLSQRPLPSTPKKKLLSGSISIPGTPSIASSSSVMTPNTRLLRNRYEDLKRAADNAERYSREKRESWLKAENQLKDFNYWLKGISDNILQEGNINDLSLKKKMLSEYEVLKSELKDREPEITQLNIDSEKLNKYSLIVQINAMVATYRQLRNDITVKIDEIVKLIELHQRYDVSKEMLIDWMKLIELRFDNALQDSSRIKEFIENLKDLKKDFHKGDQLFDDFDDNAKELDHCTDQSSIIKNQMKSLQDKILAKLYESVKENSQIESFNSDKNTLSDRINDIEIKFKKCIKNIFELDNNSEILGSLMNEIGEEIKTEESKVNSLKTIVNKLKSTDSKETMQIFKKFNNLNESYKKSKGDYEQFKENRIIQSNCYKEFSDWLSNSNSRIIEYENGENVLESFNGIKDIISQMDTGRIIIDDMRKSIKLLQDNSSFDDISQHTHNEIEKADISFDTLKDKSHSVYNELDSDLNRSKMLTTTLDYLTNSYNEIEQRYNEILSNENSKINLIKTNYTKITELSGKVSQNINEIETMINQKSYMNNEAKERSSRRLKILNEQMIELVNKFEVLSTIIEDYKNLLLKLEKDLTEIVSNINKLNLEFEKINNNFETLKKSDEPSTSKQAHELLMSYKELLKMLNDIKLEKMEKNLDSITCDVNQEKTIKEEFNIKLKNFICLKADLSKSIIQCINELETIFESIKLHENIDSEINNIIKNEIQPIVNGSDESKLNKAENLLLELQKLKDKLLKCKYHEDNNMTSILANSSLDDLEQWIINLKLRKHNNTEIQKLYSDLNKWMKVIEKKIDELSVEKNSIDLFEVNKLIVTLKDLSQDLRCKQIEFEHLLKISTNCDNDLKENVNKIEQLYTNSLQFIVQQLTNNQKWLIELDKYLSENEEFTKQVDLLSEDIDICFAPVIEDEGNEEPSIDERKLNVQVNEPRYLVSRIPLRINKTVCIASPKREARRTYPGRTSRIPITRRRTRHQMRWQKRTVPVVRSYLTETRRVLVDEGASGISSYDTTANDGDQLEDILSDNEYVEPLSTSTLYSISLLPKSPVNNTDRGITTRDLPPVPVTISPSYSSSSPLSRSYYSSSSSRSSRSSRSEPPIPDLRLDGILHETTAENIYEEIDSSRRRNLEVSAMIELPDSNSTVYNEYPPSNNNSYISRGVLSPLRSSSPKYEKYDNNMTMRKQSINNISKCNQVDLSTFNCDKASQTVVRVHLTEDAVQGTRVILDNSGTDLSKSIISGIEFNCRRDFGTQTFGQLKIDILNPYNYTRNSESNTSSLSSMNCESRNSMTHHSISPSKSRDNGIDNTPNPHAKINNSTLIENRSASKIDIKDYNKTKENRDLSTDCNMKISLSNNHTHEQLIKPIEICTSVGEVNSTFRASTTTNITTKDKSKDSTSHTHQGGDFKSILMDWIMNKSKHGVEVSTNRSTSRKKKKKNNNVNENGKSHPENADNARKDMLRMMLHQVRDIREQAFGTAASKPALSQTDARSAKSDEYEQTRLELLFRNRNHGVQNSAHHAPSRRSQTIDTPIDRLPLSDRRSDKRKHRRHVNHTASKHVTSSNKHVTPSMTHKSHNPDSRVREPPQKVDNRPPIDCIDYSTTELSRCTCTYSTYHPSHYYLDNELPSDNVVTIASDDMKYDNSYDMYNRCHDYLYSTSPAYIPVEYSPPVQCDHSPVHRSRITSSTRTDLSTRQPRDDTNIRRKHHRRRHSKPLPEVSGSQLKRVTKEANRLQLLTRSILMNS